MCRLWHPAQLSLGHSRGGRPVLGQAWNSGVWWILQCGGSTLKRGLYCEIEISKQPPSSRKSGPGAGNRECRAWAQEEAGLFCDAGGGQGHCPSSMANALERNTKESRCGWKMRDHRLIKVAAVVKMQQKSYLVVPAGNLGTFWFHLKAL